VELLVVEERRSDEDDGALQVDGAPQGAWDAVLRLHSLVHRRLPSKFGSVRSPSIAGSDVVVA
jgi:hypothetical protein